MFAFSIGGILAFLNSAIFLVGYISNNTLFPEPLSSEEERKYLELMKNGDEEARNILIERNLRLVAHVCKKYTATRVEQDDLISIGSIGLIKGINSFDSSKGVRLATYVSRCIDNEVLMYLRSTKKLGAEVYLDDPIGKDKDDNVVTLQEVLENNDKNILPQRAFIVVLHNGNLLIALIYSWDTSRFGMDTFSFSLSYVRSFITCTRFFSSRKRT